MPPKNAKDSGTKASLTASSAAEKKKAFLDELIMGTNSSSITSKRSVEKLYYHEEKHFFRFFVPRFQRRSPLVNRGYWFRLRAIDVSVREFLRRDCGGKRMVVVNLGCG
ncbi:tRNA methyltransferase ppm2, partial [Ceratocystis pirilliformis]